MVWWPLLKHMCSLCQAAGSSCFAGRGCWDRRVPLTTVLPFAMFCWSLWAWAEKSRHAVTPENGRPSFRPKRHSTARCSNSTWETDVCQSMGRYFRMNEWCSVCTLYLEHNGMTKVRAHYYWGKLWGSVMREFTMKLGKQSTTDLHCQVPHFSLLLPPSKPSHLTLPALFWTHDPTLTTH